MALGELQHNWVSLFICNMGLGLIILLSRPRRISPNFQEAKAKAYHLVPLTASPRLQALLKNHHHKPTWIIWTSKAIVVRTRRERDWHNYTKICPSSQKWGTKGQWKRTGPRKNLPWPSPLYPTLPRNEIQVEKYWFISPIRGSASHRDNGISYTSHHLKSPISWSGEYSWIHPPKRDQWSTTWTDATITRAVSKSRGSSSQAALPRHRVPTAVSLLTLEGPLPRVTVHSPAHGTQGKTQWLNLLPALQLCETTNPILHA